MPVKTRPKITLATLQARCLTELEGKAWMLAPAHITVKGDLYTVATDGHQLLAVLGDYGCAELADEKSLANIPKLLTAPKKHSRKSTVAKLLKLAKIIELEAPEPPKQHPACPDCRCPGKRLPAGVRKIAGRFFKAESPEWYGQQEIELGPALLDGWCLHKALYGLPPGSVTVEHDNDPEAAIRIVGSGWISVVMPLRRSP